MTARGHFLHDLAELERQIMELGAEAETAVTRAMWALTHRAPIFARQVIANDSVIDERRYAVEQAALHLLARQQPIAGDLRKVSAITGLASELERIGDYAEGIAEIVLRCAELPEPVLELPPMIEAMSARALAMLRQALRSLAERDSGAAARLETEDSEVDTLYREAVDWSMCQMRAEPANVESAMYYVWVAHNLERIADRTVNIAERAAFIVTGILSAAHPV
ncbi:MAG TPA: phosphate signaling complex protein PhoU [Herpetosiphonaceae bacterium]